MSTPTLSIQQQGLAGITPTFAPATAGGDYFSNDGVTSFRVKNGGASSITVTIKSPTACSQGFTHDDIVTVAAGAEADLGPFSPGRFNDASGNVNVQYSAVTSVTVAVVK